VLGAAEKYSNGEYVGVIYHFDGNNWERLKIPEMKTAFKTIRKIDNGNYIVVTYNHEGGWLERAYIFDGVSQLTEITTDEQGISLHNIKDNTYIVIRGIIYKCYKNKLLKWRDFTADGYGNGIIGWNENNFFGYSDKGIIHFNGTDIRLMYKTDLWEYGYFATGKDVFVISENPNTGLQIIIRGTLKE